MEQTLMLYIWNFTNYAFEISLPWGGYSFTLWQVICFEIIGNVLVLFLIKILMFYNDFPHLFSADNF